MIHYVKQFRSYPNIRFEENNCVSFDCSDDTFIRLARSVYTREIWMKIKKESPRKYIHSCGDKYLRLFGTNEISISRLKSSEILKLIHTMHPEKCIIYWDPGNIGHSLFITFTGRSKRMRITVPRQILKEEYMDQFLILRDIEHDPILRQNFLTNTKRIKTKGFDTYTKSLQRYIFEPTNEYGTSWKWINYSSGEIRLGDHHMLMSTLEEILMMDGSEIYVDQSSINKELRPLYLVDPEK